MPGTVNTGPHDFEAAIADLDTCFQRWPEAVRALLSARTPIDKAVVCLSACLDDQPASTVSLSSPEHQSIKQLDR